MNSENRRSRHSVIMFLGRIVIIHTGNVEIKQTTTALSICIYLSAGHKMIVLLAMVSLQG